MEYKDRYIMTGNMLILAFGGQHKRKTEKKVKCRRTLKEYLTELFTGEDIACYCHREYSARCFDMNMAKSRDIQGKIPSPQVIRNGFCPSYCERSEQ